ncbi:MAG: hypothetical protein QOG77_3418, partial [Solirubrobacteraceae bacterium]|nr:hypothetical protein [Solirubrobacteraceae bacterium]
GEQRDDALAAARKILATNDPEAELQKLLSKGGAKGEIEPWLGEKVGAFALSASASKRDGDGAIVAATSDPDAAGDWVADQGTKTETYKDVTLHIDAKGQAYALVEDRVVAGKPAAVKATVDAAAGDALADADAFKDALDRVSGDEGVGRAYLAPRALAESNGTLPSTGGMFGSLAAGAATGSLPTAVGAKFHADGTALKADIATVGGAEGGNPADPDFVAALTGKAWLAAGLGEIGPRLEKQLGASDAILGLLGAQAGLDIKKDLLAWMGEGAVFVIGDSPATIGGALVVQSKDPAASKAAVAKLGTLIERFATGSSVQPLRASGVDAGVRVTMQGVPAPVQIAAAGDRFVIAVGKDALDEAISPSSKLGDDADFTSAAATLGDGLKPTTYVGLGKIGMLAEVIGGSSGADTSKVTDTLARFTALVAADRGDGRYRASLGLR